jgi:hypothetical protein
LRHRLGIDSSHLPQFDQRVVSRRGWTDEELLEAVRVSRSISEVQRRLGYKVSSGMHRYVSAHIKRVGANTEHFTGGVV